MKYFMVLSLALFNAMFSLNVSAENVIRLEGISIQGNSEEPNVMYIMPWSPPPGTGRLYQPINSYRQQWLQPTDRTRFKRELRYAERYAPKERNQDRLRQLMADE